MKFSSALGMVALAGLSAAAFADCEQPPLVMIPDQDDVAGREQETMEATKAYFEAMQAYVDCIRAELEAAGDDASQIYRNILTRRNNAAVAEAEAVHQWFNARFPSAATVEVPESD